MELFERWLFRIALVASALGLVTMLAVMVGNIVSRALFGTPLLSTFDVAAVAGALLGSGAVIVAQIRRSHITMNFITGSLPPRGRAVLDAVITALTLMALFSLAIAALQVGGQMALIGEATLVVEIPLYPFRLAWGLACLLAAVIAAMQLWRQRTALEAQTDGAADV